MAATMSRARTVDDAARQLVGWWLDIERFVWDREAATFRAPLGAAATTVKWGVGTSSAPNDYTHELIIRLVIDVAFDHAGEYPWAQAVEGLRFDAVTGRLEIVLSADSTIRVRVEKLEIERAELVP